MRVLRVVRATSYNEVIMATFAIVGIVGLLLSATWAHHPISYLILGAIEGLVYGTVVYLLNQRRVGSRVAPPRLVAADELPPPTPVAQAVARPVAFLALVVIATMVASPWVAEPCGIVLGIFAGSAAAQLPIVRWYRRLEAEHHAEAYMAWPEIHFRFRSVPPSSRTPTLLLPA